MSNNVITVGCYAVSYSLGSAYPYFIDVALGSFPPGSYTVQFGGPCVGSQTTQFVISDPTPEDPYSLPTLNFPFRNYTDQWWDPDEPGWGIAITQHDRGQIFAVWAIYGQDKNPIWYSLQGGGWIAFDTYSAAVFASKGPFLGSTYGSEPQLTATQVGTATLKFLGPDVGVLSYDLASGSGSKSIVRLGF